jgi:hypothetical protein
MKYIFIYLVIVMLLSPLLSPSLFFTTCCIDVCVVCKALYIVY